MPGFKNFVNGQVLDESDLDTYLMPQTVMAFASAAARTAAGLTEHDGMATYLQDTRELEIKESGSWNAVLALPASGVDGLRSRRLAANADPSTSWGLFINNAGGSGGILIRQSASHVRLEDTGGTIRGIVEGEAEGLVLNGYGTASRIDFELGGTKRMRLDGVKLMIPETGASQGAGTHLEVEGNDNASVIARINNVNSIAGGDSRCLALLMGSDASDPTDGDRWIIFERGDGTNKGSVRGNGGGVSYATTSDERLKRDLGEILDSGEIVDAIVPRRFEWEQSGLESSGFFAQNVAAHVPHAVHGDPELDVDEQPLELTKDHLLEFAWAELRSLRARVAKLEAANT